MKALYIVGTSKSPEIDFKTNGEFSIKGNSYPENSGEFYEPVTKWLDEFFKHKASVVNLNVDLKYVNTSSIKSILTVITHIRKANDSKIKVAWLYELEDDDMLATGEDLQEMCDLKFEFIEKRSN
jgi:hypothetical protein